MVSSMGPNSLNTNLHHEMNFVDHKTDDNTSIELLNEWKNIANNDISNNSFVDDGPNGVKIHPGIHLKPELPSHVQTITIEFIVSTENTSENPLIVIQ